MLTCGFGAFNKDCQTVDVSVKEVATISALNSNVFQSLHTKLLQVFLFLHSIFSLPCTCFSLHCSKCGAYCRFDLLPKVKWNFYASKMGNEKEAWDVSCKARKQFGSKFSGCDNDTNAKWRHQISRGPARKDSKKSLSQPYRRIWPHCHSPYNVPPLDWLLLTKNTDHCR